jgi:hypothetical protein
VSSPDEVDKSLIQLETSSWGPSLDDQTPNVVDGLFLDLIGSSPPDHFSSTISNPESLTDSQTPPVNFPLSSDHLIHLIHHNVYRALVSNKTTLSSSTFLTRYDIAIPITPSTVHLCDGLTVIHLIDEALPLSLHPTTLQMTSPHYSWMNMFPHPSVRDNLIARAGKYDSLDFLNDLLGDLSANTFDPPLYSPSSSSKGSKLWSTESDVNFESGDVTAGRNGLIVWGEPWDVGSWEVTPGFVQKWGWILKGSDDIIAASNRWRAMRDEEPLPSLDVTCR